MVSCPARKCRHCGFTSLISIRHSQAYFWRNHFPSRDPSIQSFKWLKYNFPSFLPFFLSPMSHHLPAAPRRRLLPRWLLPRTRRPSHFGDRACVRAMRSPLCTSLPRSLPPCHARLATFSAAAAAASAAAINIEMIGFSVESFSGPAAATPLAAAARRIESAPLAPSHERAADGWSVEPNGAFSK